MTVRIEPDTMRSMAGQIDSHLNDQRNALNAIEQAVAAVAGTGAFSGATATALNSKIQELNQATQPQIQDAEEKSNLIKQQANQMEQAEQEQQSQVSGMGL